MKDNFVTLFEQQYFSYTDIFPQDYDQLKVNETLGELERINNASGHNIFDLKRQGLSTTSWVGFLVAGGISIQIIPKVDYLPDKTRTPRDSFTPNTSYEPDGFHWQSALNNLITMLAYASDIPLDTIQFASLQEQEISWFEFLANLFTSLLLEQIQTGIAQDFTMVQEEASVLHGRWDIQRQMSHSLPNQHRFFVSIERYTQNTPLNQVFRFVLENLTPFLHNQGSVLTLRNLLYYFKDVDLVEQMSEDFLNKISFNRINYRFLTVFNLARLFLSGKFIRLAGGKTSCLAFLLNMNTLFERFLAGYIKKHRSDILPGDRIESKIIAQSEGNTFYFASLEGKNKIRLQPDLQLKMGKSQHPYLLVDTKYKIINGNERKVSADDLYQVFAYSVRYHCHRVLLVYPQSVEGGLVRQKYAIQSTPATVFVGTVNLRIPLNNCPAFTEELRQLFNQAIHG